MKKRLVSWLWAIIGGGMVFVLACWLGAMLLMEIATWYPFTPEVDTALLDLVNGMSVVLGLWAGYWSQKLFLQGKLPDLGERRQPRQS